MCVGGGGVTAYSPEPSCIVAHDSLYMYDVVLALHSLKYRGAQKAYNKYKQPTQKSMPSQHPTGIYGTHCCC